LHLASIALSLNLHPTGDGVKIKVLKGTEALKNLNTIQKITCRSMLVWVNHRRKVLHSSIGHHGAVNDKTIVKSCRFANSVRTDALFRDYAYQLRDANGNLINMKGVWLLVDGISKHSLLTRKVGFIVGDVPKVPVEMPHHQLSALFRRLWNP
jgi:hypothetical protein